MTGQACEKHQHGSVSTTVLEHYEDALMGISVVLFGGVEQTRCDECDEILSTKIPDFEGLIAAAAMLRIKYPLKLRGEEIRFLRKALNMTGKELAGHIDVAAETVSRWENNRDTIGPTREKLLRLIVGDDLTDNAPAIDYDPREIVQMRLQPFCREGDVLVICMERVNFKMPRKPQEKYWGEQDKKAA